jgi:hypothetical protein
MISKLLKHEDGWINLVYVTPHRCENEFSLNRLGAHVTTEGEVDAFGLKIAVKIMRMMKKMMMWWTKMWMMMVVIVLTCAYQQKMVCT